MSATKPETEAEFDRLMEDMQVLYGMKVGHVITQDDLNALNRLDAHYRDNEESATAAFHNGYEAGKAHAGGTTLAEQMSKADASNIEAHVARTMEGFAIRRHDMLLDALEDAYRFISSPQRMSPPANGPKIATYRIEGYNALTSKLRAALSASRAAGDTTGPRDAIKPSTDSGEG